MRADDPQASHPDLADRLFAKAGRMRESLSMVYEVKWREVFITTAGLFEEAARTINTQERDIRELRDQLAIADEMLAGFGVKRITD